MPIAGPRLALKRTLLLLQMSLLQLAGCLRHPTGVQRRELMASALLLPTAAAIAADNAPREIVTTLLIPVKDQAPVSVVRRRFTGAGDPMWTFPVIDLSDSILEAPFPEAWPYSSGDFKRLDEEPDATFYRAPKLVYHIDEGAVAGLTHYYNMAIPDGSDILDICSSWVSHYPLDFPDRMKSIMATGISQQELACNNQLTSYTQGDLNLKPYLPYPDRSKDVVTCVVSFDYLTQPREVMREVARVLRPGGKLILSQSNRLFYTKAIRVWAADMSDRAHLRVLATYVYFTDGLGTPKILDITAKGFGTNDPIYIVEAVRL